MSYERSRNYVWFGFIFVSTGLLTFRPLKYGKSITKGATFFNRQSILHGIWIGWSAFSDANLRTGSWHGVTWWPYTDYTVSSLPLMIFSRPPTQTSVWRMLVGILFAATENISGVWHDNPHFKEIRLKLLQTIRTWHWCRRRRRQ